AACAVRHARYVTRMGTTDGSGQCSRERDGSNEKPFPRKQEKGRVQPSAEIAAERERPPATVYSAGFSTTRVLTATSSGMVPVSVQSPPPTPKSSRFTVALPASTGASPAVQVKVSVTGLLTPRSSSVPSAA